MMSNAQEAEVLCVLYQRLGTTLLPKLRGEFAFVIYDSKTVSGCMSDEMRLHGSLILACRCTVSTATKVREWCCRCEC
jgi:hypothetical protein